MTWDEYYEKFYDWVESTQVRYLSSLSSLGEADEVGEIIIELQVNVPASNRLLKKAVEAKLSFSASDLIEFLCTNDSELAKAALYNSANRLTSSDMEDLYGVAEDDDIVAICEKMNLTLPEDLREEEEFEDDEPLEEVNIYLNDFAYDEPPAPPAPKLGFFGTLFAAIAGIGAASNHGKRHNGKCNGDCANCPPHYGYRYGRWYYGHDHVHGCEFGGNRGSGSMD